MKTEFSEEVSDKAGGAGNSNHRPLSHSDSGAWSWLNEYRLAPIRSTADTKKTKLMLDSVEEI